MNRIVTIFLFVFMTTEIFAQETNYEKNLKLASDLSIAKSELPDSVLLKLAPDSYDEFKLFYRTTGPDHKMQNTGFFYAVTQQIFDKLLKEKKEVFYFPSIQLASFADGEFGEDFIFNLEAIIKLDKNKFCRSIKGKWFANHSPIKYYSDQNGCK